MDIQLDCAFVRVPCGAKRITRFFPATVVHDIALRHLYCQALGFPSFCRMPSYTATLPSVVMDWTKRMRKAFLD
jgi:hypothetical protein